MLHPQPLLAAHVVEQVNRFTVRVRLPASRGSRSTPTAAAYLGNTGDLSAILRPGAEVRVAPVSAPGRKLPYQLVLARQWGGWVAVDASLSSRLVAEALERGALAGFRGWRVERREPAAGEGRLDLLLRRGARRLWMEVKCTTLVRGRVARFPKPATARGWRHLETLTAMARSGEAAAICFVAQRPDARAFRTLPEVDLALTAALAEARAAGVRCRAYRCRVSQRGVWLRDEIPVLG